MRSLVRVVLFVLLAFAAIGASIDHASRTEPTAQRSCCAANADGEHAVCMCGKVEGQGCCCKQKRDAGLATCGSGCRCGEDEAGSALPDPSPRTSIAVAALMQPQSGRNSAEQGRRGALLDTHYESPVHLMDPRPPRRSDAA